MSSATAAQMLHGFPKTVLGAHTTLARSTSNTSASSLEGRLAEVELHATAREFISRYAVFFDGKDLDSLMTLYADDCVLVNTAGTYAGIDAIRQLQQGDIGKTDISFHHFTNVIVAGDPENAGYVWAAAYMYNLAVREEEPYGTVGTVLFLLRRQENGELRVAAMRIAIDSRHTLTPKVVPPADPGPAATAQENSYDLVGRLPRFPTRQPSMP